jgi:hypothetical protein
MSANPFLLMGNGALIPASTVSAAVANPEPEAEGGLFSNESAAWAWVTFGKTNAVTAAFPTAGTPQPGFALAPGSQATVRLPPEAHYIAAILRSGSGNVTFTPGEGT